MRCNPLLLVTALLWGTSGITRAAQSTNDALPELPPLQGAKSAQAVPVAAVAAAPNASNQNITSSLSFGDMGAAGGLTLSGQQLQNGVSFTLPGDLVITDAHISLNVEVNRTDVPAKTCN
jgi:hypothetical protein